MPVAPLPENESERLRVLESYGIMGTQAEPVFEHLIKLAAEICNTPMAMISLIDRNRQWFYARYGVDVEETDRVHALCAHSILEPGLTEVRDAREDNRFADSPLVTQFPHIRFYAAQPIKSAEGFCIGTVCVAGNVPSGLFDFQRASLKLLAEVVSQLFESRKGMLESKRRLTHLATHDSLTMLPNRALGLDRLKRAISRAHRYHTKAALLFIDLDKFKQVNDDYGHVGGDELLVEVAKRLLAGTRETDSVARWGGDEFLVVLSDIEDVEKAESKRRSLKARLDESYKVRGETVYISASIGLALYPAHGEDEGALLTHADTEMYQAKHRG
ncbi:MAG: sensor domain-containing diguanylate cyclase [Gammaproteobacteria bacterium]|nr:sensor domain-containing diguanylate cyclase [Gammaproteobacteria bacterium]MDH3411664.1 sensor domain-containing diguanylate cyclase [Gammaproteobacteria bacterium]